MKIITSARCLLDWLQTLKHFFINVPYHIPVACLTLMALDENCFKDWSQSKCLHEIFEHTAFLSNEGSGESAPSLHDYTKYMYRYLHFQSKPLMNL